MTIQVKLIVPTADLSYTRLKVGGNYIALFIWKKHISNISLILGLSCCMGMEKTISFFCQPERKLGSAAFLGGIGVLLMGYPFFGMIIEVYGFVALFGGFFPMAISFLRQVYFKVIN